MADVAALTWPLTRPGGMLYEPTSRVRRCLFGPVDPEKTKLHLEEQMRKIRQQERQRWNFDFEREVPLESGRYAWQRVTADPSCSADADSSSNGGSAEEDKAAGESPSARQEQTQITDFMRKRKSSNQKDSITLRKTRRRSST